MNQQSTVIERDLLSRVQSAPLEWAAAPAPVRIAENVNYQQDRVIRDVRRLACAEALRSRVGNIVELSTAQLNVTSAQIAGASALYEYQSQRMLVDY